MQTLPSISLSDVQSVYSGPEGVLWKLLMGEQIHIGGLTSSLALAETAGIKPNTSGVDLCCCNGAGMRFLVRFRNVAQMTGVDATPAQIAQGQKLCQDENLSSRIRFVQADVTATTLPAASADFVWGEDAWCYVADKSKLIAEAARITKPAGTIAFTDWVEGPTPLTPAEATRFLTFMKFPTFANIADYTSLLKTHGYQVRTAQATDLFPPCIDLYLNMVSQQLTYDALKIINFDQSLMQSLAQEMLFIKQLAHAQKIVQAMFIAQKI